MNIQICFFFLCVCNFTFLRSDLVKSQYEALKNLYDSTDGENWFFRSLNKGAKWNFNNPSSDPCLKTNPWQGVTCSKDPKNQFLASLELSAYGLDGSLPNDIFYNLSKELTKVDLSRNKIRGLIPDLRNLSNLESLDLSNNKLSGTITKLTMVFPNLVTLNLEKNYLSGTIPESIGNFSNLKFLDLSDNHFSGTIPSSIGNLLNMEIIFFNINDLNGTIPSSIGNLLNLRELYLDNNILNGTIPSSIGNLSNIEILLLNNNGLSGIIPSSIGNLSRLYIFYLYSNYLYGKIPESIGHLKNLMRLQLNNNNLSFIIPTTIGNLSNLEYIGLSNNYLSGTIPKSIGNLSNLRDLYLDNNNLSGSIPSSIGNLSNIVTVQLSYNRLSGIIPSSIGYLLELQYLWLGNNYLSGTIPSSIGDLINLNDLFLYDNILNGSIPESIGNLSNLKNVRLDNNNLTGSIPESIGNLSNLVNLYLSYTDLIGTIPQSIGNLSNLEYMILNDNTLSGTIPESIGHLFNLEYLYLMNNSLNGTIPETIGNLPNLRYLHLYNNQLSGILPNSIFNLSNLVDLRLTNNNLNGTIPKSIGSLSNLETLYFPNNQLSGTIPELIGNLSNLMNFRLDSNNLTGSIPESIGNLSSLTVFYLYYNNLSGTIPELIGNLSKLVDLGLSYNSISGTIPSSIGNLSNLKYLALYNNHLNGTIPDSLCNLSKLVTLFLSKNSLSGTIPECIGNLSNLVFFELENNYLSGTIPDSIGYLLNLVFLELDNNTFSGTIPSSIGNLSNLEILDLSYNMLVSVLPNEIGKLNALQQMYLHQNKLSGLIVPLTSLNLEVYDVRSNEFTGQIPSSLFELKSLKSLSVSDNCLSTDLSHIIDCDLNSTIEDLFLVGIGQNSRCKSKSNSMFYATHSIPDCFWKIQSLKQLYVSGNGLKGSLDAFNLPNISELSISNNRFSGTLPAFFQSYRSLKVFDIADNRFEGYLDMNIVSKGGPGNMIKADVNRLSGRLITNYVDTFDDITVLTGNLISCATLPSEDSDLGTYVCETSDLKTSVITWCVVCACFLILFALRFNPWCNLSCLEWIDYPQNLIQFYKILSDYVKQSIPISVQFIGDLYKLLKLSFIIFFTLILLTIAIFSGFKLGNVRDEFKSHTDQYLYLVSGVYLRSAGPACTLFVVYVIFFVFLVFVLNRLFVVDSLTRSQSYWKSIWSFSDKVIPADKISKSDITVENIFRSIACFIFLGVSLVANALYIIAINRLNETQLVLVQITFSLFNILYQSLGIPILFDYIFPMHYGHTGSSSLVYTVVLILVKIINPCIAIVFTDDLCFRQLLFAKQTVSVSYEVSRCTIYSIINQQCIKNVLEQESYTVPLPFIFSNQCRNAMYRNYIPTILYSCAYSTFVEPVFYLWSTSKVKSLNEDLSIYGFKINVIKLVLNDVTYSFVAINVELMLLLFYGIVSPFCAVALWASTASRILLLRLQIYKYYLLQSENASKLDSVVVFDKHHIEVMCGTALKYSHIFIQPILLLSLIFGLYLFEMAYDGEKGSVSVSICLLILITCTTFTVQNLIIWSRQDRLVSTQKKKVEFELDKINEEIELTFNSSGMKNKTELRHHVPGFLVENNKELELSVDFPDSKNDISVVSPLHDP